MKSLDTNILLYGTNADCPEFTWANPVLERMRAEPGQWIISDQVFLEYYALIRSPRVLTQPLDPLAASRQVEALREEVGCLHCGYSVDSWQEIRHWLGNPEFPARRVFDLVLAVTLRDHGVKIFFTRNVKDFEPFGFFEVVNPEGSPLA